MPELVVDPAPAVTDTSQNANAAWHVPTADDLRLQFGIYRSAGALHTCGVVTGASGGTMWCWGDNSHGQVANNTQPVAREPVQIVAIGFRLMLVIFFHVWQKA